MRIAAESIKEVKDRANLIEVVSEAVTLKRQGSSLVGLCPFHAEKTPSFHVHEEGYYYCFGCEASGNVISFVMNLRGLSYVQAIEDLAQRYNIALKYEGGKAAERPLADLRALYRLNELACSFFQEQLNHAPSEVHAYIESRGIKSSTVKAFKIGFAPKGRSSLKDYLLSKKVPESLLAGSGLVRRNARGEVWDTFRGRLIFPIFIDDKRAAGFGGRIIPALYDEQTLQAAPKYLNSPETPVYQKNRIFFGMPQAQRVARSSGEVFLVEGYMDVVGASQAGLQNVIATCGTAVTEKHIERLKHLVKRVVFLFDGDSAGRAGAAKTFPLFINSGIDASAAFLPEGEDPDTYALSKGNDGVDALRTLPRASLLDSYITSKISAHTPGTAAELGAAAKGKICEELANVLERVQNPIEQNELFQQAALRLMVDPSMLFGMKKGKSAQTHITVEALDGRDNKNVLTQQGKLPTVEALPGLDRQILHVIMVLKNEVTQEIINDKELAPLLSPATIEFLQIIDEVTGSGSTDLQKKESIKILLENLGESWAKHWKTSYRMYQDDNRSIWNLYDQCRKSAAKNKLKLEIEGLDARLRNCSNEQEKIALLQHKLELTRKVKEQ